MIGLMLYVACTIMIGRIFYALSGKRDGDDMLAVMFALMWPAFLAALPFIVAVSVPMGILKLLVTWRNK